MNGLAALLQDLPPLDASRLRPLLEVRPVHDLSQRMARVESAGRSGMLSTHDLLDLWIARSDGLVMDGHGSPLSRRTLTSYRGSAANLRAHLPDVDALAVKPAEVQRAITGIHKHSGPGAARAAYHLFSMAWKYAVDTEEIPAKRCPAVLVKAPKTRKRSQDWIPIETVRAIFVVAGRLADEKRITRVAGRAIQLGLLTGLRLKSDLLPLRVGSIDYAGSLIRIRVQKSGRAESLPVSADALAILGECERSSIGGWLFPGQGARGHLVDLYRPWARVLDEVEALGHSVVDADGKRLVPHHERHARVAHCLDAGESPMLVGLGVGQTDPNSFKHYAASRMGSLRGPAETFAALVRPAKEQPSVADTDSNVETFGRNLTAAVAKAGATTETIAKALDCTEATARNWLAGRNMPPAISVARLARMLGCSTDYLLGVES